jgi:hypothetical protein
MRYMALRRHLVIMRATRSVVGVQLEVVDGLCDNRGVSGICSESEYT